MDDVILIAIHVPTGLAAVGAGAAAMLARKGGRLHRCAGRAYLGALALVFVSGVALAVARPPHFPHLILLGVVATGSAAIGYVVRRETRAVHLTAMVVSYVAMLTAFYVDNGPELPVWRLLPPAAFWALPSLVAVPLLVRALRRNAAEEPR